MSWPNSVGIAGILGLSILAVSSAAAVAAPLTYDCDTPAGHFSTLSQVATGANFSITGVIALKQAYRGDTNPVATVQIGSAETKQTVAIRLLSRAKEALQGEFVVVEGDKLQRFDLGKVETPIVPFKLTAVGGEKSVIEIGGRAVTYNFDPPATVKLSVSCSSGEFLFSELTFSPQ